MNPSTLQTISQFLKISGYLLLAAGGFGAYYFSKKAKKKKSIQPERKETISQIVIAIGIIAQFGSDCVGWWADREEFKTLRPQVSIEANYFDIDKFALIIKTPDNKEIIERIVIDFVMDGLVNKAGPRGNIINGEPCSIQVRPFFSSNNKPVLHKATVTCGYVRPSSLNGVVIEYQKPNLPVEFDDRIDVTWYWKYKGQTKSEKMKVGRRKM